MAGFGAALSKGVEPQLAAAGLAGGSAFAKAFAPVAIAAAVIGIGVATTKMAADYQAATTLLVTGAGESEAAIGQVRQGLLDMAPAVGMGPTALAKAMFLVESAGFHGAAGLTVMAAAAQGAKVGGVDATLVADGLTTAMIDYHFATDQAATVTSKLVQTVALGKTNMGDLSSSLSNILPFAANLKVSFNDVMGAMATMTSQGIDAARASTMLKFGIMALANETPKGEQALAAIGMTTQQVVTDLGAKGLSGTIAEITTAIGKTFPAGSALAVSALSDIFGGTRGIGMALALSGQNAATFTANVASIAGAVTEADGSVKGWTLTQEDLNTQLDQVGAFLSSVGIKLGTILIPWVLKGTEAFRVFAGQFEDGTGAGGKFHDVLTAIYDDGIVPVVAFITGTAVPAVQSFVQGFKDGTGPGGAFKDALKLLYDDAVKPIGDFLTKTAIPAVKNFVQGFKDGKGPGGDFKDILKKVYDDGIVPLANFITNTALPRLKDIETWITDNGVPAFKSFIKWTQDAKVPLEIISTFIAATLVPMFTVMAASAVTSAATQVGAWVTARTAAVASAATQVVAGWTVVGSWIGSAATATAMGIVHLAMWATLAWFSLVQSAKVAAAWIASTAGVVAGWVATAAGMVATWVAAAAKAVVHALAVAASWVASTAGVVAGWVTTAAGLAASWLALQWEAIKKAAIVAAAWVGSVAGVVVAWAITSAAVIGGWISMAATAMASGIKMAAAWVIGLGPVAWVIAAIVAVGAAMVWAYNNVDWFRAGVDWMWKGIQNSFTSSWNLVIQPVLKFLVAGLVGVMNSFGSMLVVLGQVPGFGWATDAGNKVLDAAGAVRGFAADIKKIPENVPVSINVTANYSAAVATVLGGARAAVKLAGFAEGGTVLPTPGGTIVRVAEAGRKETIVDTATLNAAMAQRNGPATAPNIVYVQNPWTGEYLLAKTQAVAADAFDTRVREASYGGYS